MNCNLAAGGLRGRLVEGIRHARRYLSALRAAARVKPVIALKVGRYGNILADNHDMLQLAARLGFSEVSRGGNEVMVVRHL